MNTFRMLHVTDFHCEEGEDPSRRKMRAEWKKGIQRLTHKSGGYHLVVCTGDLGNKGLPENLTSGFKYLKDIQKAASRSSPSHLPIVITPGNHDVAWPTRSSKGALSDEDKYGTFVKLCNKLPGTIRPALHRPRRRSKTYYWNRRFNVLVLPLSSVHGSGDILLGDKEYQTIFSDHFPAAESALASRIQRLIIADMPMVDQSQFDDFNSAVERFSSETRAAFDAAVKIAVVHHPLYPIYEEAEETPRAFDTICNGMHVAEFLSKHRFHLVLYGHKHMIGTCINHGCWTLYGDKSQEIPELVTSVGGSLNFETKEKGFQEITVLNN